jgi:replicative DNA helicase
MSIKKINYWEELKKEIERGKQGLNEGIPFSSFGSISNYICGIQQGRYDVIFASTGLGKTSFVDDAYVFGAVNYLEANPDCLHFLEIIYYSLEIQPKAKIAKYLAKKIWEDYNELTTINEIYSRGKGNRIRSKIEQLLYSYNEEMERFSDKRIYFRTSLNPDFLYKDLMGYVEKKGTIIRNNDGIVIQYIPKNPSLITLVVIDHIGLIDVGKYGNKKAAIDQISRYLVYFRNLFNLSPVVITQINRSSEQMNRRGADGDYWHPMLSDIKDTGSIGEDCNTAIGLESPHYLQIE